MPGDPFHSVAWAMALTPDAAESRDRRVPMSWYLQVWQRYAEFTGRSRRMEFWMFFLYNVVILLVLYLAFAGKKAEKREEAGAP